MSRRRKMIASAVILFIIAGQAYAFIRHSEPWPFSRYTLYSAVYHKAPIHRMQLVGLTLGGDEVVLSKQNFPPMDGERLHRSLGHVFQALVGTPQAETELGKWYAVYESGRVAGRHDGPRLAGMRLYDAEWHFRGDAANAKLPPNKRYLVAEFDPDDVAPPVVFDEFTLPARQGSLGVDENDVAQTGRQSKETRVEGE